jgi:hypothetical protein
MTSTPRRVVLAVDAAARDIAAAEHVVHLLDDVLPAGDPSYVASTHVVDGRVVVVASWDGTDPASYAEAVTAAVPGAAVRSDGAAVEDHVVRRRGRLARFAGRAAIERRLTVREVLEGSAVDAVEGLAGVVVEDDTVVDLTDWARPTWRAGRTVILVQPARDGLVPFEARQQIACCADH